MSRPLAKHLLSAHMQKCSIISRGQQIWNHLKSAVMIPYDQSNKVRILSEANDLREEMSSNANVHVWRVDLTADQQIDSVTEIMRLLSAHERTRASEFKRQEPRTNYVKTRGALRRLLGMYLRQHPAHVKIETAEFGKPFLASSADAGLCFNASHSGTWALVAIGRGRRIGVDIEQVREDLDYSALIQKYFAAEERAELAQRPSHDSLQAFFDCWTWKEAYLKATGKGLSTPLDSFVVSTRPGVPNALIRVEGNPLAAAGWTLRDVLVARGYSAAVAAEGKISEVRCLDYAAAWLTESTGGRHSR